MLGFKKSNTEEKLIKGCKKGNPKAQQQLYDKYCEKMLGVCVRYVVDRFEAEDVMIKGFTKVFEKINQFGFEGSFEGWVRRIMINEALMYLRKNKPDKYTVDIDTAEREIAAPVGDTNLETTDLLSMIQELPSGYRSVFNLYAVEGYGHKEIAEMLGVTEGTSKSQLSKARKMLQGMLEKREQEASKTLSSKSLS